MEHYNTKLYWGSVQNSLRSKGTFLLFRKEQKDKQKLYWILQYTDSNSLFFILRIKNYSSDYFLSVSDY